MTRVSTEHSLLLGEEPEAARLLALEVTVQGMVLDSEQQADHQSPDDLALFNVVATNMPDTPPPHVIQHRREARQCLAGRESSSRCVLCLDPVAFRRVPSRKKNTAIWHVR